MYSVDIQSFSQRYIIRVRVHVQTVQVRVCTWMQHEGPWSLLGLMCEAWLRRSVEAAQPTKPAKIVTTKSILRD